MPPRCLPTALLPRSERRHPWKARGAWVSRLVPPSSLFLSFRVDAWSGFAGAEAVGHIRVLADERQARRVRLLLQQRGEIGIAVATSYQALDELMDDRRHRHRHLVFSCRGQ